MKRESLILIIALILLAGFMLFLLFREFDFKVLNGGDNYDDSLGTSENLSPSDEGLGNMTGIDDFSSVGGGGSGGGSSGDNLEQDLDNDLPGDSGTVECGFYFERYGLCSGKCSLGVCISEGRSCYCKINP